MHASAQLTDMCGFLNQPLWEVGRDGERSVNLRHFNKWDRGVKTDLEVY